MEVGSIAQRTGPVVQANEQFADQFDAASTVAPTTYGALLEAQDPYNLSLQNEQNELEPEAFQDQTNVLGRVGELASAGIQGIKNRYENARNNLNRVAALGGIALAGIGAANAGESISPDLAIAQDPQATTSTAMSPEVAACIKDGTAMPEVKRSVLSDPGQREEQDVYVRTHSKPQDPECIGETTRKIKGKAQIAKWNSHHRKYWKTIGGGEMYRDFPDGSYSALGSGQLSVEPGGHNGLAKSQLYTCLPGPRKRPVRALIERNVTYKATGKTYRKFSPISVKVRGGGC